MYDSHEDVHRRVFRNNQFASFGKKATDNALQLALSVCVFFTFDAYNVDPEKVKFPIA